MAIRLFLLCVFLCHYAASQNSQQLQEASQNPLPQQTSKAPGEKILNKDEAEIFVFAYCFAPRHCPIGIVYTLGHEIQNGALQVFNLQTVDAEFPLPDLSAGRHVTTLPHAFYWKEQDETFPNTKFSCYLGTSTRLMHVGIPFLWAGAFQESAYDYKPDPRDKMDDVQYDEADEFRGDVLGITSFVYPEKRNRELRARGKLPEAEILGVGFVEGTKIQCRKAADSEQFYPAPLRDVRVVSVASHKANPDIPVLKAGRFTMPKEIFQYPNHIRIATTSK